MPSSKAALIDSLRDEISRIESAQIYGSKEHSAQLADDRNGVRLKEQLQSDAACLKKSDVEAFAKIERLASRREYSRVELANKLKRCDFEEPAIEVALNRACACGLVSDARYGDVLVRSRISQGKGLSGIARELQTNGIDPYSVDLFVQADEHSCGSEVDRAIEVLRRNPPRSKHPRESAYRRLVSKGYDSASASSAARIWYESLYETVNS